MEERFLVENAVQNLILKEMNGYLEGGTSTWKLMVSLENVEQQYKVQMCI